MKRLLTTSVICGVLAIVLAGCGEPKASNVMENVDQKALADYEKMIEDEANAMTEEAPMDEGE